MILGLYQSAAGMMTQQYRMDTLANNLANAETTGFKREMAVFAERKPASVAGLRRGPTADDLRTLTGGTWLARTQTDFSEAGLQQTGQPLDVAVLGPGFLRVQTAQGELLTRDGRLTMLGDGTLASAADASPVLDEAGAPIRLNPRGEEPSIDADGAVRQGGAVYGRLGLVDVDNVNKLQKTGGGRFALGEAKPSASPAEILSGHVERSGVEPVRELVTMMQSTRAFQLNAQMLTLQDQTVGRLISAVAGA